MSLEKGCAEVERAEQHILNTCITENEMFQIFCLNTRILDVELQKVRYFTPSALLGANSDKNRQYRHGAYQQFTWWVHGRLGRGVRVPLPSCVVTAVRARFPSVTYNGFQFA
ncbi:uncharacterized protein LOC135387692 [Ornithodoros turicata]|uniref:uncharacterized protein LOC135387692 n=1 Tax=Ornithodoros turicata TaxID=34597 RepID=UPI003138DE5B